MEINLVEILKNVPKGTKLYSTIHGKVLFDRIDDSDFYPIYVEKGTESFGFTKEGLYSADYKGECTLFPSKENRDWSTFKVEDKMYHVGDYLRNKSTNRVYKITKIHNDDYVNYTLASIVSDNSHFATYDFVREESLDSNYEICKRFPLDTLKPFDRVLVRDDDETIPWKCGLFSHISESRVYICGSLVDWDMCVPYNSDTEHLVGTTDDEPEFYKL